MTPITVTAGDTTIHVKNRAVVVVGAHTTTKIFTDPACCATELHYYQAAPWACPDLVDHGNSHIVIPTYPTAAMLPDWRPAGELLDLLLRLQAEGIHHRDVHVKNVVKTPTGPKLIDWESAITVPGFLSYDIYGPYESGLTPPEIHEELIPQHWNSKEFSSIANVWGINVTDLLPTHLG